MRVGWTMASTRVPYCASRFGFPWRWFVHPWSADATAWHELRCQVTAIIRRLGARLLDGNSQATSPPPATLEPASWRCTPAAPEPGQAQSNKIPCRTPLLSCSPTSGLPLGLLLGERLSGDARGGFRCGLAGRCRGLSCGPSGSSRKQAPSRSARNILRDGGAPFSRSRHCLPDNGFSRRAADASVGRQLDDEREAGCPA